MQNLQKLNFESQNLIFEDYITLTLSTNQSEQVLKNIALYFYTFCKFNSFIRYSNERKIVETLLQDLATRNTLIIRMNYWNKIVLEFSGFSAYKFYQLFKSNKISLDFLDFNFLKLSRLDICYDSKKSNSFNFDQFDEFLIELWKYVHQKTRTKFTKLITKPKGNLLGINQRSNSRYYRVYEIKDGIRFELELKRKAFGSLQDYFFGSEFKLFENSLVQLYFGYFTKWFPLDSKFVRWLIDFNRRHINNQDPSNQILATEYLKNNFLKTEYNRKLFHLLQFLNFVKTLNEKNSNFYFLKRKKYIIQNFYLKDFIKFIGTSTNKQNQRTFKDLYQVKPVVQDSLNGKFEIFSSFYIRRSIKLINVGL